MEMSARSNPGASARTWQDDPVEERRTNRYIFASMKALIRYFSPWYAAEDLEAVIREAQAGFVARQDASQEETHLQVIKKCEFILVQRLQAGPPG
jgi:hypothetical protein